MKSKIKIKPYRCLCDLEEFEINGIKAEYEDFGRLYDHSPNTAEPYGCGDMQFTDIKPTEKILDKYRITVEEYYEICEKLESVVSFGSCGWCV